MSARRTLLTLLAALAFASALLADPLPPSISLREAEQIALRANPVIASVRAAESAAQARRSQARAAWLPQITLSESYTRGDNPVFVFGSLLEQGQFGPQNFDPNFLNDPGFLTNYRFAATLRYTFFDQLRRISAGTHADLAVEQASGDTTAAMQSLRLEVIERYTGVLVADARRDAAARALEAAESDLGRMRDRLSVGLIAEADLLAGETQASEFRMQLIEAEGGVRVARSALAASLNLDVDALPELNATLGDPPVELPELSEALRSAREARAELQSARLGERQADLGVRTAAGQFLPRLDGYYSYGASGESFGDHNDDSTYGAVLSWNVLDPGRIGRLAEAKANRAAASAATAQLERGIDLETTAAWERARVAQERRTVALRAVEQAREAMRMVRDRYQEGLTTITEDLRAQAALLRAEMNLAGARSDFYSGYANLLRATGRLTDVASFE